MDSTNETESTPIADQIQEELKNPQNFSDVPQTAKSYKVDVDRCLARETQDGKGDEDPGESDWVSYATDGVEVND